MTDYRRERDAITERENALVYTRAGCSNSNREQVAVEVEIPRLPARYSFEELCLPHWRDVVAFVRHLSRDRALAEDVAQETYLLALRRWSSWAPEPGFEDASRAARAWLHRIAKNYFIWFVRLGSRRRQLAEQWRGDVTEHAHADAPAPPEARLSGDEGDVSAEVAEVLADLPSDQRDALVETMRAEDPSALPAALGTTSGNVRKRRFRASAAARPKLAEYARREYGLRAVR